jgi:hypothetical protein
LRVLPFLTPCALAVPPGPVAAPGSAPAATATVSTTAPPADTTYYGSPSRLQAGDRADPTERACDGAHDHCLPVDAVFAYDPAQPDEAFVGWPTDDGPWLYIRSDDMRGGAQSWTSERATAANLSPDATIVYFNYGDSVPTSEANAVAGIWRIGTVVSIDGAAGTLVTTNGTTVAIDSARLVH